MHLAAPTIRLLDKRSARGSEGSEMRPHNWAILAVMIERRGSFFKEDLAPRVAASLENKEIVRSQVLPGAYLESTIRHSLHAHNGIARESFKLSTTAINARMAPSKNNCKASRWSLSLELSPRN